jgi:hypothetical protein
MLARYFDIAALAEEAGMAIDEFHGNDAITDELSFAIDIFEHEVEQFGTLEEAWFDGCPFFFADEKGDDIEAPGTVESGRVAIYIIGNAIFFEEAEDIIVSA